MLTASARPDPNAPFARAEITVRGLTTPPRRPEFQLRRSNVDYVEPNLDLAGWTRAEVVLLPLDAWWAEADRSFHLLISGLLCQFIEPGPLKLRLPGPGGGEIDLFWPEDISVYDDGNLATHARVLTDTVRVVGTAPPAPVAEPIGDPEPAANPWGLPAPAPAPVVRWRWRWRSLAPAIVVPVAVGVAVIGAVANRGQTGIPLERLTPAARDGVISPPRPAEGPPRPAEEKPPSMRAALDRVLGEFASARRADFDPFLALRPANEIINQTSSAEALLRYGATKLDEREPGAADRLFEEATRPRFGPGQNRPYAPAFVARALLYDPSVQHELILPVPNAGFAETLYRRAIASGDGDAAAYAGRHLPRLLAWEGQHIAR